MLGGTPVRERRFPAWPIFDERDEARVLAALRSGHWGRLDGTEVTDFEKRFAALHGCEFGIAMVNGTVSLRLGLMAAGLEAESEVIIPPYTFFSTASAVIEANMVPVFADVDRETFNLDPRGRGRHHAAHPRRDSGPLRWSGSRHGGHHGGRPKA